MTSNTIENYHPSYSSNYYEEGKVYGFFVRNSISQPSTDLKAAPDNIVEKYAQVLQGLDGSDYDNTERAHLNFGHFYGVVVDIVKDKKKGKYSKINIMLHQDSSKGNPAYILKSYVVGYKGIWADGKGLQWIKARINQNSISYSQSFRKKHASVTAVRCMRRVKLKQLKSNHQLRMRGLSPRLKRSICCYG